MKIIGIDPGTQCTGFGIIEFDNNRLAVIKSGVIHPNTSFDMPQKLELIYDKIINQIKIHSPDEFSLETAFYGKNVQSTLKIGYVRGVALLAAAHTNLKFAEYSPREVKKAVVGNGAASKEQVQFMVKKLLALRKIKIEFDETDALAVAICHAFKMGTLASNSSNWKKFVDENPERVKE